MTPNDKHRKFVELYCMTGNAIGSYKEVYKCAHSTAKGRASKLLDMPEIQAEVAKIQEELWKKTRMNASEVLALLAEIARGNTTDQVVQVLQNGEVVKADQRVSNRDRIQALTLLGKNYKLFTDRIDVNQKVKKDIKVVVKPASELKGIRKK